MHWTTIRRVGQPVAWLLAFGGEVWTLVTWFWGGGLKLLEGVGAPEYAALTAIFGTVLLYSSWALAQPHRSSRRLEAMIDEMTTVRRSVESHRLRSIESPGATREPSAATLRVR